ncbi:hypothetical protein TNCV_393711 [Trichonephila clavipes]|nr:hypothetical protein TNCV_393711 [Trichonephila clavipes]
MSYHRGLQNVIFQQDNARPHVARHVLTFFDTRGILCFPVLYGLQISHPMKTSGHELLRNWSTIPLQLIHFLKSGIDHKQHEMCYPFLSSNSSSILCLTGQRPY